MKVFLINNETTYSFDKLLQDINLASTYYPQYKAEDLYGYFVNFLIALVHNKPLILLDSDSSSFEHDILNNNLTNVSEPLSQNNFNSISEIVDIVINSVSEITIFTSGTTGQPKKVIHSVQTLIRNARKSKEYNDNIWAFAYNPTHMAGLQVFFQAFLNLNTIVNVFDRNRNDVYTLIDRHNVTHISGTPTFYRLLLPVEKPCNSLIRATMGGEKSDTKLLDVIRQIFPNAKINNIYASTEAGSLFSAKGEFFKIPTTIQDKIRVIKNELYIHKSLLGKSESFIYNTDEYYRTGDLIEWENREDGLFRFNGRANELINIGGYKVNPDETERAIFQLDGVNQVVVYGKSNSVLGNILCADIMLKEKSELTEFKIREYLKGYLQDYKIPRRIRFVDAIEVTRTGKIKRL